MSKKTDFKISLSINNNNDTIMSLEFIEDNLQYTIPEIILNDIDIQKTVNYWCPSDIYSKEKIWKQSCEAYITLPILSNRENIFYIIKDLNYKEPKELTIKEIEEQLGYRIKIKGE